MVPRVYQPPNGIPIGSAVLAKFTRLTNTQREGERETYRHIDPATYNIAACMSEQQAVVNANSQSNGKGQISTPFTRRLRTP